MNLVTPQRHCLDGALVWRANSRWSVGKKKENAQAGYIQ